MLASLITSTNVNTLVIILVGVFLFFYQIRNGTSKISSDTIEAYKSQVDLYEKRIQDQNSANKELTEQVRKCSIEISELKGFILARDKQIEEMRSILENRNPELDSTLKQLLVFMKSVDGRLASLDVHLGKQDTNMLEMRVHQPT